MPRSVLKQRKAASSSSSSPASEPQSPEISSSNSNSSNELRHNNGEPLPPNHFGSYFFVALASYFAYKVLEPVDTLSSLTRQQITMLLLIAVFTFAGVVINSLSENHETERFRPSAEMLQMEVDNLVSETESESSDDDDMWCEHVDDSSGKK